MIFDSSYFHVIWFSKNQDSVEKIKKHISNVIWIDSTGLGLNEPIAINRLTFILYDLTTTSVDIKETIRNLKQHYPLAPILMIGQTESTQLIEQGLEAGAIDFYSGQLDSVLLVNRLNMLMSSASKKPAGHYSHQKSDPEVELAFLAFYDALTELPNRMFFSVRLDEKLKQQPSTMGALFYIDLDGFKTINDTHTHRVGDWILKQAALRLKSSVRRKDMICRIGGDEFSVFVSNIEEIGNALVIGQRIIYTLSAPYLFENNTIKINASVGIAITPIDSLNSQDLINKADKAMYHAKQKRPGTLCLYSELPRDSTKDSMIAQEN